jgi:group I intron endonuclease
MGFIYVITNMKTGKKYVGKTMRDVHKRWAEHKRFGKKGLGKCRRLVNSIHKHGLEYFKFQIMCVCFDEALKSLEMYYIQKLGTLAPHGYNLTEGGEGGACSEETRMKFRKPKSVLTRLRMSESAKQRPPMSQETRQKIRLPKKRETN